MGNFLLSYFLIFSKEMARQNLSNFFCVADIFERKESKNAFLYSFRAIMTKLVVFLARPPALA